VIKAAQRLGFALDEVADLFDLGTHQHGSHQHGSHQHGTHRHGSPPDGLQAQAQAKLVEVEAKIADLQVIARTLRAALAAGCDDLITCAGTPRCPLPFADLADDDRPDAL
jgi:MerR family transcriptional regulator, mercuric resistance operon regulatory protein